MWLGYGERTTWERGSCPSSSWFVFSHRPQGGDKEQWKTLFSHPCMLSLEYFAHTHAFKHTQVEKKLRSCNMIIAWANWNKEGLLTSMSLMMMLGKIIDLRFLAASWDVPWKQTHSQNWKMGKKARVKTDQQILDGELKVGGGGRGSCISLLQMSLYLSKAIDWFNNILSTTTVYLSNSFATMILNETEREAKADSNQSNSLDSLMDLKSMNKYQIQCNTAHVPCRVNHGHAAACMA